MLRKILFAVPLAIIGMALFLAFDAFSDVSLFTTPIGVVGSFTTLSASSTVSGTGFTAYMASPPAIGGTAPAAGTFTTLTDTTHVAGGTKFTVASGTGACATSDTTVGGASAGSLRCTGSTGASTVTLTLPSVTHAYAACTGRDVTNATAVTQTGAVSQTAVTFTLTSVTQNDIVQFGCPIAY